MKKTKLKKVIKRIGKILLGFLILFVVLVLLIRTPWAQNVIVSKITQFVSDKTHTKLAVEHVFITFSGAIELEQLYVEDKKGDTLLYSKNLQLDLPLYPLLFKNELSVDDVVSDGLVAKIARGNDPETFNFTFLIDAFATPTDTATTTEPLFITLGDFDLKNWNVVYTDEYLGTQLQLKLGTLETSFDAFYLETMKYDVSELLLENTSLVYHRTHDFPESTGDTSVLALPYITIEKLDVNQLTLTYDSKPDNSSTRLHLGVLSLTDILADASQNRYETDDFTIKDSEIALNTAKSDVTEQKTDIPDAFTWPEFILMANTITVENNTIAFNTTNTAQPKNGFDPNNFRIRQLRLEANDFVYQPEKFRLNVGDFGFYETSGIHLEQLAFAASLTNTEAEVSGLTLRLNQSAANAHLKLNYGALDSILKNPENSYLSAELNHLNVKLSELQKVFPILSENTYLNTLAAKSVTGNLSAEGNLKEINNLKTNIAWGNTTTISANGSLTNLAQTDSLTYDLNDINIKSNKTDLQQFVSSDKLGISIPQKLLITGSLSGTTTSINTDTKIQIPEGTANVNGSATFEKQIGFKGKVRVDTLQLGTLLQNEQLGTISLQMEGSGSGSEIATLDATVFGNISQFELNGYAYKNIQLEGELTNGTGNLTVEIDDANLNVKTNSTIDLQADMLNIQLRSKIIGADLQKLGFTKSDIKIAADITGSYSGSPSNYNVKTTVDQAIAVTDNEQYQIDAIALQAHIEDSITDVSVSSGFINGELHSNASPARINTALKKQLEHYFTTDSTTQVIDSVKARMNFAIKPAPVLDKVFFKGFTDLDSLSIDANFDAEQQTLYAEIKVPKISYAGSSIDSLNILLNGDASDLKFSAGLGELAYQPFLLKQTYLEGNLKNKELLFDFNAKNDSVQVMHIASELQFEKDTLRLHISPNELLLNQKQWKIPKGNAIVLADSFIDLKNIVLSKNQQKLQVSTKVPKMPQEHIGVLFENFELQTFLSLFNPDEALAKGRVGGDFVLLNPFDASGLVSDIEITDFKVMQNPLGTLALNAASKSLSNYDFDLALRDGDARLNLAGDYTAMENDAKLNMELDIKEIKTSVIQGFLKETLSEPKGYISGSMLVNGNLSDPQYSGRLNFTGTELTLTDFNTQLSVDNQVLDIDQDVLSFSNFEITDKSKGNLLLDGNITTSELANPEFDFTIKADKFRVLNSDKGDNELVYGIASVNADLDITGDLKLPVINGKVRIRDVTDLKYIVPQEQLEIQERDGIVIFVNKENPDAILARNDDRTSNSVFAGMDINTILEIGNEATFTIILDEKTQDMLKASGDANLNLNIDPNSDIRLSGKLELNSGFYRTSLYNLVSREFQIKKGSSIVWRGDPFDAQLDVTAIYEIETSPSPLMSSISAGQDSSVSSSYQQAAHFMVYLNLEGELTEPELSFSLDMPENEQGSFGGEVYGRIQQLNEQESELNKQVFSLLALNRFYPTTGSDGSSGGAMTLARNNVNKVLSNELNAISDKLLGNSGFELGFDLDSFEDYETGTAENRTQLNINASKKLFNDRLIVTAGSALDVEGSAATEESATPIIGNVTLEYLLNEKGIYRLKGFRKQEYQNIIDGQLIVTGIAFIFNREFNKFSQLFTPVEKSRKEHRKAKKKDETDYKN